jgi:GMP synthase (glutamine-hydrolysing)
MITMRLLVADGNTRSGRDLVVDLTGATAADNYAVVLRKIAPTAHIDICMVADEGARPPTNIRSYDGIVITGSSLTIYKVDSAVLRQIDFMREVFAAGIPSFGSCWGLQLATVAAGGQVGQNPCGLEIGFARKITLTAVGRGHPMHKDRPLCFDAPAVHNDIVVRLPERAVATASNDLSEVQAAEICSAKGIFWGVQFHPELDLNEVAGLVRLYGTKLVEKGFFVGITELESYANDLNVLQRNSARWDIAWRYGLGEEITNDRKRACEIKNWIEQLVLPHLLSRSRG